MHSVIEPNTAHTLAPDAVTHCTIVDLVNNGIQSRSFRSTYLPFHVVDQILKYNIMILPNNIVVRRAPRIFSIWDNYNMVSKIIFV